MDVFNSTKDITPSKEMQECCMNLISDAAEAILGDPVAKVRLLLAISKSPLLIQNQLFWFKFQRFLNGVYIDENCRLKMVAQFSSNGKREDNAFRLISVIERTDSIRKIDFIINVTNVLLSGFIDLMQFFRIVHVVSDTLLEDLLFLKHHIGDSELLYSLETQGLLSNGLVHLNKIGENTTYKFTPLAFEVDRYAVSYGDINRYPNPLAEKQKEIKMSVTVPVLDYVEVTE